MLDGDNQGIQMSGGSIQANQIAVGTGARAVQHGSSRLEGRQEGLEAVIERLRDLEAAVDRCADQLDDPGAVRQDSAALAEELARKQPDRNRVGELLGRIASGVQAVAALASASTGLADAVRRLLS